MKNNLLLEIKGLSKSFGALKAVDDVTLDLSEGSMVGLIGPNGSGKSTLFNLIAGFIRAQTGEIYFQGKRIDPLPPNEISEAGIVKGFQIPRNFSKMTVLENVLLSPKGQVGEALTSAPIHRRWNRQEKENGEYILPWLETVKLRGNAADLSEELSGGQMKLLDIVRGVTSGARLILLDEPTAGVAPTLAEEIFKHIISIREQLGASFFIIEHRVETLLRYVDRILVMHMGKIIYDGTPKEVVSDTTVKEVYLGQ